MHDQRVSPARRRRRNYGGRRADVLWRAVTTNPYRAERLERRVLLSAMSETEPNDTPDEADFVPIAAEPIVVSGTMGHADFDYFAFTLPARSGVFFDTDAREIGIADILDTRLALFTAEGAAFIAENDDGRDFDTIALNETGDTRLPIGDSALYADLPAGDYVLQVYSWGNAGDPVEPYELKITADASFTSVLPVFSSLPGAADTLYLDFDGHSATDAWGTYTIDPFDFSGNPAEWTPAERAAIETTWRVVADAFAPFNINVTTTYAGPYNDGQAHRQVIGNSDGSEVAAAGALGIAWFEGYSGGGAEHKTGFTFADNFSDGWISAGVSGEIVTNAIEMGNTTVHEFGHALGLEHYLDEAHSHAFMHTPDFGLNRARWSSGTNEGGSAQDDMAIIAGASNTFGYRVDDIGPGGVTLTPAGDTYATNGVIHQTSDVDTFHFSGSGATTITLEIPEHWGHLDGEISLHDASGALLASDDDVEKLGASITYTLPVAGDYYVEVRSDAGEGEVGQYSLKITTTPPATGGTIAGRTFRDTNYNGVYETALGDAILGNVVVYLDANGNETRDPGEEFTTSSSIDGTYAFTNLAPGTYNVRQVAPAEYVNAQAYARVVTSAGETFASTDFGNFPIVYAGGGGSEDFTLRLTSGAPARVEIVHSAVAFTYSAPVNLVGSLAFAGNGGNDRLTIDYVNGDPVPAAGGVSFDGGTHSSATTGDQLIINGSAGADSFTLKPLSAGAAGGAIALADIERSTVNGGLGNDALITHVGFAADFYYAAGDGDDAWTHHSTAGDDVISLSPFTALTDAGIQHNHGSVQAIVINAGEGNDDISATVGAESLTVNGGGDDDVLNVNAASASAPVVFNGGTQPATTDRLVVTAGAYTFNSDARGGTANLEVVVNAAAAVTFNATQHLERLEINGGSAVMPANGSRFVSTATLLLTGGARFDLVDNDLYVREEPIGAFDGSAYDGVAGYIASAYSFSAWDGPGLATSMTDATVNGLTGLGVARVSDIYGIEASQTEVYNGETLTGATVIVKYTYAGDLNLDGLVDAADYGAIDNWVQFPGTDGYFNGDFNYDGVIDAADYGVIDNSIQLQGPPL